jgi:hypothetical protein
MQIQKTINPETVSIFNNGEYIGDINDRNTFFEAVHKNGMKAIFSTFDGAKKLFEEVVKPSTIKPNNQINLF